MIKFKVDDAKHWFFDREKVIQAAGRAKKRVLSRFGSFVRRDARKSIRNRKKVSKPGQPPSNRTGILKRFIYFVYDATQKSVLIGPAKTNQIFFNGDGEPVTGTVPEVLEYGGEIGILEVQNEFTKTWSRADLRSRRRLKDRRTRLRYADVKARPYMTPAFTANREKHIPAMWRDTIK